MVAFPHLVGSKRTLDVSTGKMWMATRHSFCTLCHILQSIESIAIDCHAVERKADFIRSICGRRITRGAT